MGLTYQTKAIGIMDSEVHHQGGCSVGRAELALVQRGAINGRMVTKALHGWDVPKHARQTVFCDPRHTLLDRDAQQLGVQLHYVVGIIDFLQVLVGEPREAEDVVERSHCWPPRYREGSAGWRAE